VRRPWTWIGQRFYTMLSGIFPQPPITYYSAPAGAMSGGTVFIEADSPSFREKGLTPQASAFLSAHPPEFPLTVANAPPPTTDNWPYVYHHTHSIPRAYFAVSAIILVMALYMVAPFFRPKESSTWQFLSAGSGISPDGNPTG
jgi:hypothetical protein